MVQAKRQQQTLQGSVDKRGQDWGCGRRIRDPHTKRVNARLYHRPDHGQDQGNDHRPGNADHRNKPFSVKECQRIRQFAEIVITVVDHTTCKTGNDSDKHTHIQSRCAKNGSEITIYQDFLSEQRMGHCIRVI